MTLRPIDNWFLQQEEPFKNCFEFLRLFMLRFNKNISEEWKYGLPFYYYRKKPFCYLWFHKKYKQPYIGIVKGKQIHHPDLLIEKRATMKILLIDPEKNIPVRKIKSILIEAMALYK